GLHLLIHGGRGDFFRVIALDLGRGLPLLDAGFLVVVGRGGARAGPGSPGLRPAALLPPAAPPATLLAPLRTLRPALRRGGSVLALVGLERLRSGVVELVGLLRDRLGAGV